ncbi:MAG: carbon monoxide dehydrogenase [Planctomycetes bacterium]|nr:carbon monoxide dehydrogenase [Planctomycetota bacterium]
MTSANYLRPTSLGDALEAMATSSDARFVAGGTDLMVGLRKRRETCPTMISLRRVAELKGLEWTGDRLRIGAAMPLSDIVAQEAVGQKFPALAQSIAVLGSVQIRNVATLGGNLCNASPAADTAPALLAYDAQVELASINGTRQVALDEFFTGPGATQLRPGEILAAVLLQASPSAGSAFTRLGRVRMDLAQASAAALLEMKDGRCLRARVAVGAVAPTPLRLSGVEDLLQGSSLDPDTLAQAQRSVAGLISPISDLRASAVYRRRITPVLVKRAVVAAAQVAAGGKS